MKKYIKKLIFMSLFLLGHNSFATIDILTNTTWTDIGISDDVVIHPGATLTIHGGLQMAPEKYIHVLDGGELRGIDGYIYTAGLGQWKGIYLDQTPVTSPSTNYGLYLYNFRIEDAYVAISSAYGVLESAPFLNGPVGEPGHHNRRIRVINTTFQHNKNNIKINNHIDDLIEFDLFNYSQIIFQNCQFLKPDGGIDYDNWPIHILFCKQVHFFNCDFTANEGNISLHFRTIVDSRVSGCHFEGETYHYISLHGPCNRNQIVNNYFDLTTAFNDNTSNPKIALELGHFATGAYESLLIKNNDFIGDNEAHQIYGIGSKEATGSINNEEIVIEENRFKKIKNGIKLGHLDFENEIIANEFEECDEALHFFAESPGMKIECNIFTRCSTDIFIEEGAYLQNQTFGYDPNNQFSNLLFPPSDPLYNIINEGSTSFYYQYKDFAPTHAPGSLNIFTVYTPTKKDCSNQSPGPGDNRQTRISITENETQIKNGNSITQYPNPVNSVFFYNLSDVNITSLIITDLNGRIVKSVTPIATTGQVDVNDLAEGTYICIYFNQDQVIEHKKFMLIK